MSKARLRGTSGKMSMDTLTTAINPVRRMAPNSHIAVTITAVLWGP